MIALDTSMAILTVLAATVMAMSASIQAVRQGFDVVLSIAMSRVCVVRRGAQKDRYTDPQA